jgi:thioredoxin-related protein
MKIGIYMKKCNANGNHLYSDHLTHCPWCDIKKDTGKDFFPDSTGLQMAMPATITKVSTPVTESAQLKIKIPTPSPASTPRGYSKVATFFVLAIIFFLIFTTFNNTQKMAIPSVSNQVSQIPVTTPIIAPISQIPTPPLIEQPIVTINSKDTGKLTLQSLNFYTSIVTALSEAKKQNTSIFLYARSDSCGWCKKFEEETFTQQSVIKTLNNKFILVSLDVYKQKDESINFKVRGTPTMIFLNSNGNEIKRIPGYTDTDTFLNTINGIL